MEPSSRPPGRVVVFLATAGAAVSAVVATVVFGTLAILLSWIPPRGRAMVRLCRVWSRVILLCSGVRVKAEAAPELDRRRSYVFLSNHQSYFDIPALLATIPGEARFAARHDLFRIPFFGWALTVGGFIPIDREDRSHARDAFKTAGARLTHGGSVLFFPEGTRSHDGSLGRFQRGGMLLALKRGLPIVPVGIRGARAVMRRGRLRVSPGTIGIRYGRPIDVTAYGVKHRRELAAEVRARVAQLAGLAAGDAGP